VSTTFVNDGLLLRTWMDDQDERLKAVIVGDGFCGKTCMVLRYIRNEFPESYVPTICEATAASIKVIENERLRSTLKIDYAYEIPFLLHRR